MADLIGQTSVSDDNVIAVPPGGQAQDQIYVFFLIRSDTGDVGPAAGWSLVANGFSSGPSPDAYTVIWKKLWAGETTVNLGNSPSEIKEAVCQVWRGLKNQASDDLTGNEGLSSPALAPAVFSTASNDLCFTVAFCYDAQSNITSPNLVGPFTTAFSGVHLRIDYAILGVPGTYLTTLSPPPFDFDPQYEWDTGNAGVLSLAVVTERTVAIWELPALEWTAEILSSVVVPPTATTQRFDAGLGSRYWLLLQLSDSGDELRSKTVKDPYVIAKSTNQTIRGYRVDVGREIDVQAMEDGDRLSGASRALSIPDTSHVVQCPMRKMSLSNASMHTMRIEGDDTGQSTRDRIDQITYQIARQGVRR